MFLIPICKFILVWIKNKINPFIENILILLILPFFCVIKPPRPIDIFVGGSNAQTTAHFFLAHPKIIYNDCAFMRRVTQFACVIRQSYFQGNFAVPLLNATHSPIIDKIHRNIRVDSVFNNDIRPNFAAVKCMSLCDARINLDDGKYASDDLQEFEKKIELILQNNPNLQFSVGNLISLNNNGDVIMENILKYITKSKLLRFVLRNGNNIFFDPDIDIVYAGNGSWCIRHRITKEIFFLNNNISLLSTEQIHNTVNSYIELVDNPTMRYHDSLPMQRLIYNGQSGADLFPECYKILKLKNPLVHQYLTNAEESSFAVVFNDTPKIIPRNFNLLSPGVRNNLLEFHIRTRNFGENGLQINPKTRVIEKINNVS
jgi:hypothetical protein